MQFQIKYFIVQQPRYIYSGRLYDNTKKLSHAMSQQLSTSHKYEYHVKKRKLLD